MILMSPGQKTEFDNLVKEIRSCQKCCQIFENRYVEPLKNKTKVRPIPIFGGSLNCKIILIGQAPGIEEHKEEGPFKGSTGKDIKDVFSDLGFDSARFDRLVYQTSITKCYPGRKIVKKKNKKTGKKDDKEQDWEPTEEEVENCLPYLVKQIELVRPVIIVLLGGFAISQWLKEIVNGQWGQYTRLKDWVGKVFDYKDAVVIPFPHLSRSSFWLNPKEAANRMLLDEAKGNLGKALLKNKLLTRSKKLIAHRIPKP